MKEFVEKLIARLEEVKEKHQPTVNGKTTMRDLEIYKMTIGYAEEIINQLAEEYKDKYVMRETLNQYMWERDIAVSQLRDLGYGLGEKVGWIPCSEKMPEECQKVWLSFTSQYTSFVKSAWWVNDHFEWNNGRTVKDVPLAWKPYNVPDPYIPNGGTE